MSRKIARIQEEINKTKEALAFPRLKPGFRKLYRRTLMRLNKELNHEYLLIEIRKQTSRVYPKNPESWNWNDF